MKENIRLRKGIHQVVSANIISLIVSLCNGFIVPKYLSLSAYSGYKTFILYTSYLGVLHLGYIDGVYIKFGGKNRSDINPGQFYQISIVLLIFQAIIAIIGTGISVCFHNNTLLVAALCIVPSNMLYMYKFIFQAIGEFDNYKKMITVQTICVFIYNLFAIFVLHSDNAYVYMYGFLAINLITWLLFSLYFKDLFQVVRLKMVSIISILKEYISLGIVIMFGNLMTVWMTSVDRWFVKIKCSEEKFAYYSFAVTMLRLVNVVFSAFSITLYNYFCENRDRELVREIRQKIIIVGGIVISCSFVLNIIVDIFIPKYEIAESIIIILISSQLFYVVISAVYLNLYKAMNRQKRYLIIMLTISVISILLNIFFGVMMEYSMESFAYATLLSSIIWLIICQIDLGEYRMKWKEWIFLLVVMVIYYGLYYCTAPIISFCIYNLVIIIMSILFFKQDMLSLVTYALEAIGVSLKGELKR